MDKELGALCADNRGLVYMLARRYAGACARNRAVDWDDLTQAGYIGLLEAARTYRPERGAWSTWAALYIRGEMRAACGLRGDKQRPELGAASLDAPIGDDALTLGEILPGEADTEAAATAPLERAETVRAVRQRVAALPDANHREAVRRVDLLGQRVAQAARELAQRPATVQAWRERGRRLLRRDRTLRELAEAQGLGGASRRFERRLDQRTDWTRHVGARTYQSTWQSSTEALVWWRERQRGL